MAPFADRETFETAVLMKDNMDHLVTTSASQVIGHPAAEDASHTEFEPTFWHKILAFPFFMVFGWGVGLGIILSPIIQGFRIGVRISDEFWGFDKQPPAASFRSSIT
jgi:hypothetical protein